MTRKSEIEASGTLSTGTTLIPSFVEIALLFLSGVIYEEKEGLMWRYRACVPV